MSNVIKLTDPHVINRLKLKNIERRLLYIIGISTALEHDLEQAADSGEYKPLDEISRSFLAGAIKRLANDAADDLNGLEHNI